MESIFFLLKVMLELVNKKLLMHIVCDAVSKEKKQKMQTFHKHGCSTLQISMMASILCIVWYIQSKITSYPSLRGFWLGCEF